MTTLAVAATLGMWSAGGVVSVRKTLTSQPFTEQIVDKSLGDGSNEMWNIGVTLQAIDRLPVVPGLMEVVGIGYSGVR